MFISVAPEIIRPISPAWGWKTLQPFSSCHVSALYWRRLCRGSSCILFLTFCKRYREHFQPHFPQTHAHSHNVGYYSTDEGCHDNMVSHVICELSSIDDWIIVKSFKICFYTMQDLFRGFVTYIILVPKYFLDVIIQQQLTDLSPTSQMSGVYKCRPTRLSDSRYFEVLEKLTRACFGFQIVLEIMLLPIH